MASSAPIRRIAYRDAMETYGSDKPDLRIDLPLTDISDEVKGCGFEQIDGKVVKAIAVSDCTLTRKAIDQLYAKLQEQAADPMKMGAVQGQYGQFNSAATIIGNLTYNEQVSEYQKDTGGFPASVLKSLFGVKEVEPFA